MMPDGGVIAFPSSPFRPTRFLSKLPLDCVLEASPVNQITSIEKMRNSTKKKASRFKGPHNGALCQGYEGGFHYGGQRVQKKKEKI